MRKIVALLSAVLMTLSLSGQRISTHHSFLNKAPQQKTSGDSLMRFKYFKYLPHPQSAPALNRFKNTEAVKQQLDVVYWADQEKNEYRYDNKGNVIEDIYFEWYDNQWEKISKSEYIYDNNGNNTQYTELQWVDDQWLNDYRYEAAFDSDGNNTLNLSYMWDGTEWVNIYEKEEYAYDAKGNLTGYISSFWDGAQYMNSGKEAYTYDDKGNLSLTTNYLWDGAQWVNSDQSVFTYDSKDVLTLIVASFWDGNNWIDSEKFELSYDPSGNISQAKISGWEEEQWIIFQTVIYEYDSRGNITLLDVYVFDINAFKEVSVYDDQGNRIENIIYEGDWETGLLAKSMKTEASYDNSFVFDDLILPFISEDYENDDNDLEDYGYNGMDLKLLFNHKLLRMVSYEGVDDNWVLESDYMLVYSEQNTTGIWEKDSETGLSLYPNPASSQVTFSLEGASDHFQIKIFDIQGKMVISQIAENNKPVSIGTLSEGVYFYQLQSEGNIFSGKLLISMSTRTFNAR